MARRATSALAACWFALAAATAAAQAPADAKLATLLDRVPIRGSADQRQQIVDAIAASPTLVERFAALSARDALTAIDVVEPRTTAARAGGPFGAADPVVGPFAAALDGSRIVLSSSLLPLLRKARLFDVVNRDDVLPNQTVFVLAHLAAHLDAPVVRAPQPGEGLEAFTTRMIAAEAGAYIAAWDATLEEAVNRRGGSALTPQQVGSLLLNGRYRFALLGDADANVAAPHMTQAGFIEATPANVDAVVRTLRHSAIADLQ